MTATNGLSLPHARIPNTSWENVLATGFEPTTVARSSAPAQPSSTVSNSQIPNLEANTDRFPTKEGEAYQASKWVQVRYSQSLTTEKQR